MNDGTDPGPSEQPRRRRVLGAVAGLLGLAGCSGSDPSTPTGGGSGDGTDTASGAGSTSGTEPPERPPVEPTPGTAHRTFQRNPGRTGHAPDGAAPDDPAGGWRVQVDGAVHSSPAVVDGAVYVVSLDGYCYAFDHRTGERRWRVETGGGYSSPTVVDGVVYVGSGNSGVFALDAETGDQRWYTATGGQVHSSPAVLDEAVYVGSFDSGLHALDRATGERRWRFETDNIITGSPAVADGAVLVASHDGNVYAVERDIGEERWRRTTAPGDTTSEYSSVTVGGDTAYMASIGDKVYALELATGGDRFRVRMPTGMLASPAVAQGTLYVPCLDGYCYAFDRVSGEQRWRTEVGPAHSSPGVANGRVHLGTAAGVVVALEAETGDVAWRYDAGADVRSSPALAAESLVVGTSDGEIHGVGPGLSANVESLVDVVLDGAPDGLEKFTVRIELDAGRVVELDSVLLSDTGFWVESGGIGDERATVSGLSVGDEGIGADTVTLFALAANASPDAVAPTMTVETLTNGVGEPLDTDRVRMQVREPDGT